MLGLRDILCDGAHGTGLVLTSSGVLIGKDTKNVMSADVREGTWAGGSCSLARDEAWWHCDAIQWQNGEVTTAW